MIILDGKVVGTANDMVELTQAEYDALSDEKKTDGTMYYITDSTDAQYQKLLALNDLIGKNSLKPLNGSKLRYTSAEFLLNPLISPSYPNLKYQVN